MDSAKLNSMQAQLQALYKLKNSSSIKLSSIQDNKQLYETLSAYDGDKAKNKAANGTLDSTEINNAIKDLEQQILAIVSETNSTGKEKGGKAKLDILDVSDFISSNFEGMDFDGNADKVSTKEKNFFTYLRDMATKALKKETTEEQADVDGDGKVTAADYQMLADSQGADWKKTITNSSLKSIVTNAFKTLDKTMTECNSREDAITLISSKTGVNTTEAQHLADIYGSTSAEDLSKLSKAYKKMTSLESEYKSIPKEWKNLYSIWQNKEKTVKEKEEELEKAKATGDQTKIKEAEAALKSAKSAASKAKGKVTDYGYTEYSYESGDTKAKWIAKGNEYLSIVNSLEKAETAYETQIKDTYGDKYSKDDISKIFANEATFKTAFKNVTKWADKGATDVTKNAALAQEKTKVDAAKAKLDEAIKKADQLKEKMDEAQATYDGKKNSTNKSALNKAIKAYNEAMCNVTDARIDYSNALSDYAELENKLVGNRSSKDGVTSVDINNDGTIDYTYKYETDENGNETYISEGLEEGRYNFTLTDNANGTEIGSTADYDNNGINDRTMTRKDNADGSYQKVYEYDFDQDGKVDYRFTENYDKNGKLKDTKTEHLNLVK